MEGICRHWDGSRWVVVVQLGSREVEHTLDSCFASLSVVDMSCMANQEHYSEMKEIGQIQSYCCSNYDCALDYVPLLETPLDYHLYSYTISLVVKYVLASYHHRH